MLFSDSIVSCSTLNKQLLRKHFYVIILIHLSKMETACVDTVKISHILNCFNLEQNDRDKFYVAVHLHQ